MSNRLTLCRAIKAAKIATVDDLCELIPMWSRKKIQDTLKDISTKNFTLRKRDDVTGLPAYELTKEGNAFLKAAPEDAPAVKESLTAQMPTDKECCNAAKVVATTAGSEVAALNEKISKLELEASDYRIILGNIRSELGIKMGDSIKLSIQAIQSDRAALQDDIRRQVQRAEAAEANRDDLQRQRDRLDADLESILSANRKFCSWVNAEIDPTKFPLNLHECQQIIADFSQSAIDEISKAQAQSTAKYALAFPSDFFDTIEAAIKQAESDFDAASIDQAMIVTMQPIGRIKMAPTFVPMAQVIMETTTFREVALALIQPSPTNPRKTFPAEDMAEMIDSVQRHGILQPILVRPWPAGYDAGENNFPAFELVAGERRYRAATAAGLAAIPATIRDLSDHEVLEMQIIENLQRKGLNELEEAEGYDLMIKRHGYTADQLAEKIGKSRAYIYGRLKLIALSTPAREAFRDGRLSASTALLIARIPGEAMQREAIQTITESYGGPMSYRQAAQVIQRDYCFTLDKAPFPQENPLLLALTGPCSSCPKRSGNCPELCPDIARADVCTDPQCFKDKTAAWLSYQAAEAKQAGRKVIIGKEAEKIDIQYSDQFLQLDAKNYRMPIDGEYRTNREILQRMGQKAPEAVLVENTRHSTLVEAIEAKQLMAAMKSADLISERPSEKIDKEKEAKIATENAFRQRLFDRIRSATRRDMEEHGHQLEMHEAELVAKRFWSCLWREDRDRVARYWITDKSIKGNELMKAMDELLDELGIMDIYRFMLDCALIGQTVAHTVDSEALTLLALAKARCMNIEAIRAGTEDQPNTTQPVKFAIIDRTPCLGDTVRINDDAKGPSGQLRKCAGREGKIEATFSQNTFFAVRFGSKKDVVADLRRHEFDILDTSTAEDEPHPTRCDKTLELTL